MLQIFFPPRLFPTASAALAAVAANGEAALLFAWELRWISQTPVRAKAATADALLACESIRRSMPFLRCNQDYCDKRDTVAFVLQV